MEHSWPLGDLDEVQWHLSCGVSALGAVHDAMAEGPFPPENYVAALFAVYEYLCAVSEATAKCVDACCAKQRKKANEKNI